MGFSLPKTEWPPSLHGEAQVTDRAVWSWPSCDQRVVHRSPAYGLQYADLQGDSIGLDSGFGGISTLPIRSTYFRFHDKLHIYIYVRIRGPTQSSWPKTKRETRWRSLCWKRRLSWSCRSYTQRLISHSPREVWYSGRKSPHFLLP